MNKYIFAFVFSSCFIVAGCATSKDPVTHNPGWQVPDTKVKEEPRKEDHDKIDLREIF